MRSERDGRWRAGGRCCCRRRCCCAEERWGRRAQIGGDRALRCECRVEQRTEHIVGLRASSEYGRQRAVAHQRCVRLRGALCLLRCAALRSQFAAPVRRLC